MKRQSIPKFVAITLFSAASLCCDANIGHAQTADEQAICKGDYFSFCISVIPGNGRILACLKKNYSNLSSDCKKVVDNAKPGGM